LKAQINLRYKQIIGSYLTENCVFRLETSVFVFCTEQKLMLTGEDHKAHRNINDVQKAEFLSAFVTLRKATIRFVMFVCLSVCLSICQSAWNNSAPTGRICMKFGMW